MNNASCHVNGIISTETEEAQKGGHANQSSGVLFSTRLWRDISGDRGILCRANNSKLIILDGHKRLKYQTWQIIRLQTLDN